MLTTGVHCIFLLLSLPFFLSVRINEAANLEVISMAKYRREPSWGAMYMRRSGSRSTGEEGMRKDENEDLVEEEEE